MKVRIEFEDGDQSSHFKTVEFIATDRVDAMARFMASLSNRHPSFVIAEYIEERVVIEDLFDFLSDGSISTLMHMAEQRKAETS